MAASDFRGPIATTPIGASLPESRPERQRRPEMSDGRLLDLFASIELGTLILDTAGRVEFINDFLLELLERTREEMLGCDWIDTVVPARERLALRAGFESAIAAGSGAGQREDGVTTRSGEERRLLWTSAIQHDAAGNVVGMAGIAHDVTEQRRAEKALRESEERFRTLFDSEGDAVIISDSAGHILEANRAACTRLGCSREELITMTPGDINPPRFPGGLAERVARIPELTTTAFEAVLVARDGTLLPSEVVATTIEFNGRPAVLAVARDITERKRMEKALELSELKFATAFRTSPDAVVINRLSDGLYLEASDGVTSITGYAREEVVGRTAAEVGFSPNPDVYRRLAATLKAVGSISDVEATLRRKDGTLMTGLASARLMDVDGEPCILAIVRDISDRKRAEAALLESESRFRALLDQAPVAISVSRDGIGLYGNRRLAAMFGLPDTQAAVGKPIYEFYAPLSQEDIKERVRQRMLGQPLGNEYETVGMRTDGVEFPVGVVVGSIELPDGQANIGFITDLTDAKRAEADRVALEDRLRQALKMEAVGRLAGGVAHDFNNLLTVIRGNASFAIAALPSTDGLREDLEQVEEAADRASALTRQLLTFARKSTTRPEPLDLGGVVCHLEPMLRRVISEDITLLTSNTDDHGFVMADPGQIEQVILNLVVNASDAMPDGGTLRIETTVSSSSGPGWMELSVADTGVGMDAATLERIFEPFFTTKEPGKGTGLGLATVYGIVDAAGGAVTVASEPGHGSTFTVRLPRLESPGEALALARPNASAPTRSGTILIVEDDPGVAQIAKRILESAGYAVLAFSDGDTAVAAVRDKHLDLLLTDVVMPGMRGREVAAAILAGRPSVRVVYMSGHAAKGLPADGELETQHDFVAKPFTAEQLIRAVDAALAAAPDAGPATNTLLA